MPSRTTAAVAMSLGRHLGRSPSLARAPPHVFAQVDRQNTRQRRSKRRFSRRSPPSPRLRARATKRQRRRQVDEAKRSKDRTFEQMNVVDSLKMQLSHFLFDIGMYKYLSTLQTIVVCILIKRAAAAAAHHRLDRSESLRNETLAFSANNQHAVAQKLFELQICLGISRRGAPFAFQRHYAFAYQRLVSRRI